MNMSSIESVQDWLEKLGYYGEMPENFQNLCNSSTSFIWEQLVSNIKPKQEIEVIRKNLIIRRLQSKSLKSQHEFDYPNKDIDAYRRYKQITARISVLKNNIEEKQALIQESLHLEKEKYVIISSLKSKIRENEEKAHLISKRFKMSKEDLSNVQEMISFARNLTPVELDDTTNEEEIKETLQKCAEKLENLVDDSLKSRKRTDSLYSESSSQVNTPSTRFSSVKKVKSPENRRDSLGLLPESLIDFGFDDSFNTTTISTKINTNVNTCRKELFFSSTSTNFLMDQHSEENSLLPECLQLYQPQNINDLMKICEDKKIEEVLKSFLHQNNRGIILKSYQNLHGDLINNLQLIFQEVADNKSFDKKSGKEGLINLQFLLIQNEVKTFKFKKLCNHLDKSVEKLLENIKNNISSRILHDNRSDLIESLESKIQVLRFETTEKFLKKQIADFKIGDQTHLDLLHSKLQRLKGKNALVVDNVEYLIANSDKVLKIIKDNRNLVLGNLTRLNNLDLDWIDSLKSCSFSKEIDDFDRIRLDFNRNRHQIFTNFVPFWMDFDSANLKSYLELIQTPFSNPEDVFLSLFKLKKTLETLKLENAPEFDFYFEKKCLDSLKSQEKFVPEILDKFEEIIRYSAKKVLPLPQSVENSIRLITEQPFKKYIPGLKDLEKKFEHFYNKL